MHKSLNFIKYYAYEKFVSDDGIMAYGEDKNGDLIRHKKQGAIRFRPFRVHL